MLFQPGQKIVFIGDSITDCGRRDSAAPYGDGYVNLVRTLLLARYPDYGLTVVNRGVSGDTTRHLAARWTTDVLAEQPAWVALMIGINDVWRAFDANGAGAVPLAEYTSLLHQLLRQTQQRTPARLILLDPYMIEPDRSRPMRRMMDRYGAVLPALAAEYGALHVPTQAAFDTALLHTRPTDWAADSIHPNAPGHAVIALAFLRTIEFAL